MYGPVQLLEGVVVGQPRRTPDADLAAEQPGRELADGDPQRRDAAHPGDGNLHVFAPGLAQPRLPAGTLGTDLVLLVITVAADPLTSTHPQPLTPSEVRDRPAR